MKFLDLPGHGSQPLPDIASKQQEKSGSLDWVGMSHIELPVILERKDGSIMQTSAKAQAYVNLTDPQAKGIHMSRLYLLVDQLSNHALDSSVLAKTLEEFLASHEGMSDKAFVEFAFDYLIKRPALKSTNKGWKAYPVKVAATLIDGKVEVMITCEIPYSSTCPCSAALARQLIQQQFARDYGEQSQIDTKDVLEWLGKEEGIIATPHSQRSIADVKVALNHQGQAELPITELIDALEDSLKTPVQTAVKREDEQAFALLNGQNLMFCEDAARRVQAKLDSSSVYSDFWVRINHMESLHAHDAVSVVVKGLADGFKAIP